MKLYREIEIKPELIAKVSTIRLHGERNFRVMKEIGSAFSGQSGSSLTLLNHAEDIVESLKESLSENHTSEEVEGIVSHLRFSTKATSPFGYCLLALIDIDGPEADVSQEP